MSLRIMLVPSLLFACFPWATESFAAACEADGAVQFLCGPVSPEDLAVVPESPWLIASGMEDDGYLYLADTRDYSSSTLFPTAASRPQQDRAIYGDCPGPVSGGFRPHGLSLRVGADQSHTLYVVRHGARESIEVFDVDASGASPTLTWIGCIVAPESVVFNSVAALPGGGIVATHFQLPDGALWEWHSGTGWSKVPGSEMPGPNGIEVSADGRWFYIGGWATQSFIRLSRGQTPVQMDSVNVGHHIDNLRWAPDGSLFAAGHVGATPNAIFECLGQGQCDGVSSRVSLVDPDRLTARELVNYPSNDFLILGTVAIQVGEEIWVGGIAGSDRIARFPAP